MNPTQFVAKWRPVTLPERAASQEHFLDLCRLVGVKTPAELDPVGDTFTFEKGIAVSGPASAGSKGDRGFADVWYRGRFAWEYKRRDKHKDLKAAYDQLLKYREALDNPPLLVVSDIARIEIHTNFTGTAKQVFSITLDDIESDTAALDKLRRVFNAPESFKPTLTPAKVTEQVAADIGKLAQRLRDRGHDPHDAAHFLMKCMFCLFAEDVGLLPSKRFESMLDLASKAPDQLTAWLDELFTAMKDGGFFWGEEIDWFNGGLFDGTPALALDADEIDLLRRAARQDWGQVEPAIFGTLFERSLDPSKRAQIGAHYTSRDDIMLVIEPVILRPLRAEWNAARARIDDQLERRRKATTAATKRKADAAIDDLLQGYLARLSSVRVLDPACGSGNFLYIAIQNLLDLEKRVITYAATPEIGVGLIPRVRPTQLHGIEINPYAAELAQVVIWIGYLQWMRDNGFNAPRDPILEPMQTIEQRDAILRWADEDGEPIAVWREGARCLGVAEWPEAEFIVGNPPFLGGKLIRGGLGDQNTGAIFKTFSLPNFSDLCCYWFELASRAIAANESTRAGLLATQSIRGGASRTVLERIAGNNFVFEAWSDRKWLLDGAAVQVSIVCFTGIASGGAVLDGVAVPAINADLTGSIDLTSAQVLAENEDIGFIGTQKSGPFNMNYDEAADLLRRPNPIAASSLDVMAKWYNGSHLTGRSRGMWCVYFPHDAERTDAARYEAPFEHCVTMVAPQRKAKHFDEFPVWLHWRPRPELFEAKEGLPSTIVTPRVSKYRVFCRLRSPAVVDSAAVEFARSDDYFFGVLHSSIHELWALRQGTQLESRPRYTPTTCFETFPLPWPPGEEPTTHTPHITHQRIAQAAKELDGQRERWLNPPEWVAEVAEQIDNEVGGDFADVARVSGEQARRLIRQSAIDAASAKHPKLKKRTLTNLYNERPTWLALAHKALDQAVLAAYAAVDPEGEWDENWAEVWAPAGAGQPLPEVGDASADASAASRAAVEEKVLANLLRLNLARAGAGA